jgi:hypothetical protein
MVPIDVPNDKLDVLAATFGCSKGSLPFTYLGLPLSIDRPNAHDFLLLINVKEGYLVFLLS